MPDWAQELAAITTVAAAAVWLLVRWLRIGKPRETTQGCARCEHNRADGVQRSWTESAEVDEHGRRPRAVNPLTPAPSPERGVRSKLLRVIR